MEGGRKMKKQSIVFLMFLLLLSLSSLALSEEGKPQMRKEMVKLKYLKPGEIHILIQPFMSREGRTMYAPEKDLITVSDYPEIVERVLAVIKEIDVRPVDLLFTIQLVLGSESVEEKSDETLLSDPIIKELRGLLKYRSFSLLDSTLIRTIEKERAEINLGKKAEFELQIYPKYIKEEKEELIQIEVSLRQSRQFSQTLGLEPEPQKPGQLTLQPEGPKPAGQLIVKTNLIKTTLTIKSGEKTVVGVSKLDGGDKGLILIISGKVIK